MTDLECPKCKYEFASFDEEKEKFVCPECGNEFMPEEDPGMDLNEDTVYVANYLYNIGMDLHAHGKSAEAEPHLRRVLAIHEKLGGKDHLDVAKALVSLASVLGGMNKYTDAEQLYRRALAILEKKLNREHPDVAPCLINLAMVLNGQGKFGDAESFSRRALAIQEKKLGASHLDVGTSLSVLAMILHAQGKTAEAEPIIRRALAIQEKGLGQSHVDVGTSLNVLAVILHAQGKSADAEQQLKRALSISEKALGRDHAKTLAIKQQIEGISKGAKTTKSPPLKDEKAGTTIPYLSNPRDAANEIIQCIKKEDIPRFRVVSSGVPLDKLEPISDGDEGLIWSTFRDRQGKIGEASKVGDVRVMPDLPAYPKRDDYSRVLAFVRLDGKWAVVIVLKKVDGNYLFDGILKFSNEDFVTFKLVP